MQLRTTASQPASQALQPSFLAPLAFAGKLTAYVNCPVELGTKLKLAIKCLQSYDALDKQAPFSSQSAYVKINDLSIGAFSSSASQYRSNCNEKTLFVPFAGTGLVINNQQKIQYRAGVSAALLSQGEVNAVNSMRSVMVIKVDETRLRNITRDMLNIEDNALISSHEDASREVSLAMGNISFDTLFRHYASIINQYHLHPNLLNKTGIDDGIYSAMAMMLQPKLFADMANHDRTTQYDQRLLDRTCQYIQANLTNTITLSMLDNISHMSRRKLHYAFQDRYGCSPMRWVRNERLILANNYLRHAQAWDTVTAIAYHCGFTKLSSFASNYQAMFGELPSVTLSKQST